MIRNKNVLISKQLHKETNIIRKLVLKKRDLLI